MNSSKDAAPIGQWPYTVRVGDLCYVALGQIVNRRYYIVGPDFGNGIAYDGVFLLEINSPVERPALAAAARADWGHLTAAEFAAQLRNEAETRSRAHGHRRPARGLPAGGQLDGRHRAAPGLLSGDGRPLGSRPC